MTQEHTTSGLNGKSPNTSLNGHKTGHSNGGTHPTIDLSQRLHVERSTKAFASKAVSKISLPAGSIFAHITGITEAPKAFTSVQTGRDSHIELNSDLVFCNHSCNPSLEFDMSRFEVRVSRARDLKIGDALTFWYPSTEWDMAQPFDCTCGTESCKRWIAGAGRMDRAVLKEYWLNPHIVEMLRENDGENPRNKGIGLRAAGR